MQRQYVDKTGMISLINDTIGTPDKLTCISRPRRFGKSFAAQMLCAYYDKTCDSSRLFADKAIAKSRSYREYLNKYDVIYLNMTDVLGETKAEDLVAFIKRNVVRELMESYPSLSAVEGFSATLVNAVEAAGNKFIMIIDEWDAPIRENSEIQREYLEFSRTILEDKRPDTMKRVQESDQLIMDTIHMNAEAVAGQIEKVHIEATNPLNANNENSLRAVIQLAYFSYKDHYMKMEELPAGQRKYTCKIENWIR